MEEVIEEPAELVERVAALAVGKATLVACARVPHDAKPGRRRQQVRSFATTTRSLPGAGGLAVQPGRDRVVMESTSLLEVALEVAVLPAGGAVCVLAGERPRRQARAGRPKTDKQDAVWLAKLPKRGMLRGQASCRRRGSGSYGISPATGASASMSGPGRPSARSRLLEDAQIKLSVVAADMFGVSGRQLLEALIAGQRDPKVLAQLAQGRMRAKLSDLEEALTGHFRAHHGYLLRMPASSTSALTSTTACIPNAEPAS